MPEMVIILAVVRVMVENMLDDDDAADVDADDADDDW